MLQPPAQTIKAPANFGLAGIGWQVNLADMLIRAMDPLEQAPQTGLERRVALGTAQAPAFAESIEGELAEAAGLAPVAAPGEAPGSLSLARKSETSQSGFSLIPLSSAQDSHRNWTEILLSTTCVR